MADETMSLGGGWLMAIVLIVLFFIFGGRFFGGNANNAGIDSVLGGILANSGHNSNNFTMTDAIVAQMNNGFSNTSTQLCNGFNSVNLGVAQGVNSINTLGLQNTYALTQAIDNNRFASQQCCCEVKSAIAEQNALNYRNTCDITNTVREQANETRALLVQQQIIDLEAKLAERDRELQTAKFEASQIAQTSALIQTLAPRPIPAYATCSPYMSNMYATGNCAYA